MVVGEGGDQGGQEEKCIDLVVDVEMEHVGRFAVGTVVGRWNQFDGDGRGVGAMLPYFLQEWQQLLFDSMEVLWVLWRA